MNVHMTINPAAYVNQYKTTESDAPLGRAAGRAGTPGFVYV